MSLPIVILPTAEKWDCHQCGICCRGSLVPLSDEDVARLNEQKWAEHADYVGTKIMVPNPSTKNRYRLAQRKDGSCVFLQADGLCRIHAELGYEAKPTICRVFPLQLIPRGSDVALTIRRACPSSAADKGRLVKEHLPFIKDFVREGKLSADAIDPPPFKVGETRDWKTVSLVFKTLSSLLRDLRYPPVRRIVHALQFTNLLETAKTRGMDERKLAELITTLAEVVPEESKQFFSERRPPSLYARLVFHSVGIEYARLHPKFRALPTWSHRWQLAKATFRLVRGRGPLPDVSPAFPKARLEDLEHPLGQLAPEVDHPLARLIEASSESNLYALADRRGWTILESIRGLVVTFPVGLWLLRWASQGREPTVDDMLQIVVALDRGQGFAALTGKLHRSRLRMMATQGELERLVVWYAR